MRRIGCQPLSAGQVVRGHVEGGKLQVLVDGKTKTYRIETSAYIGPTGKGSPGQSATAATPLPPSAPESTEPSVKLAVHTEKSDATSSDAGRPDHLNSATGTGKVMVSSEPTGADIYVDGNFMGNTPSLIDLPAGSHTVRVEAKGQTSWSRTVSLTAGSKVTLQAAMDAVK